MTAPISFLEEDFGGRVCMGCDAPETAYEATLFAYSSYTKRDSDRGDVLFLATQTKEHWPVVVEFPRVPYRLYLTPTDFEAVRQRGIISRAEYRRCSKAVDSLCSEVRELIEVRFYSRARYTDACRKVCEKKLPVAIDGAHDYLHGLDSVFNLGIPGSCATLRLKHAAAVTVTPSLWRIQAPVSVCCHGWPPRCPVLSTVVAISATPTGRVSICSKQGVKNYGVNESGEFLKEMTLLRPQVVLVRNREETLMLVHQYASAGFSALFTLLPRCQPSPPRPPKLFSPGLGVLVFDVTDLYGLEPTAPIEQWLEAFHSGGWLKDCWNEAVVLQTAIHHCFMYEAFTAAMVLHYALNRMVCTLPLQQPEPYQGGHTIPPHAKYLSDRPVAIFDFVSMYPSIACGINAGKDTYVREGGDWELGEVGGFATARNGSLAVVLKERLQERLRIVDDPSEQARARYLKKIINGMVGMSGHKNNPYSDTRVAGCITSVGRRLLRACHRQVADITLAGYTDSLFLELPRPDTSDNQLDSWMSQSVIGELEVRFKNVIATEVQSMTRTFEPRHEPLVRFECKQITISALFTGKAHAYAAAFLKLGRDIPQVDIEVKGYLKFPNMECIRLFHETLICLSVAGEFVMSKNDVLRLGDIRVLNESVPILVMTSSGWRMVENVIVSNGPRGTVEALVTYADSTQSRHWFLPQVGVDRLVEVTQVICLEQSASCNDRRRLSVLATTKAFFRQLCRGQLPLSAYAIEKGAKVLVHYEGRRSMAIPISDAARNGSNVDLEQYRGRWMQACVDNLTCKGCQRRLTKASECRYVPTDNDAEIELAHESCAAVDAVSLENIDSSILSKCPKTALSAILVAGTTTALDPVARLIDLSNALEDIRAKEYPPIDCYAKVLTQINATIRNGKHSKEYLFPPRAFVCLPDGQDNWYCILREPKSPAVLDLIHKATRSVARYGNYIWGDKIRKAVKDFPAHRLRVSPPPVLMADFRAPDQAWQRVMDELAVSKERPNLVTATSFSCELCSTVFNLKIGACGHLACKTCCVGWCTCAVCNVKWQGFSFTATPQMNYNSEVFPFEKWYEYLPDTNWRVYCGPEELIYDSSARHIIELARGERRN